VRLNRLAVLIAGLILIPAAAHAQDFGIMESAETINQGNFKIRANPMFLLGRNGGDADPGVAVLAGYGSRRGLLSKVASPSSTVSPSSGRMRNTGSSNALRWMFR